MMKAWSWFLVLPLVLVVAYFLAPTLKHGMASQPVEVVGVAPLNLPNIVNRPMSGMANMSEREIQFAAFGIVTPTDAKTISRSRPPGDAFSLQSILMTGNSGSAVIDGNLVHPGDIIGAGYRIAKIDAHSVWLSDPRVQTEKHKKREYQVLRFPEYQDYAAQTQTLDAPGHMTREGVDKDYRKILEMLKL